MSTVQKAAQRHLLLRPSFCPGVRRELGAATRRTPHTWVAELSAGQGGCWDEDGSNGNQGSIQLRQIIQNGIFHLLAKAS